MKQCTRCTQIKENNKFSKQTINTGGMRHICKECILRINRTKIGKIQSIYYNQVESSKRRKHAPPSYNKQELIDWCIAQPLYHKLHEAWAHSKYNKWLSPSCDRINDSKPYTFNNLQLMTWKENDTKGVVAHSKSVVQ